MDAQHFTRPADGAVLTVPVLVAGGSTAAYAATLAALEAGAAVCLVQPTAVVGGQHTAQALPASDDPPQIAPRHLLPPQRRDPARLEDGERFGLSRSLRRFRQRQRQLQPVAGRVVGNPGASWVSHFSVTPATAAAALEEPLLPFLAAGRLTLVPFAEPVAVHLEAAGGVHPLPRVRGVSFADRSRAVRFRVEAAVVIEATDLGDLLELGGIDSRVGQEARSDTGEAVLPGEARPACQQAFTYGIVVEHAPTGAEQRVPAPEGYGRDPWLQPGDFPDVFWLRSGPGWKGHGFFDPMGMFRYRRLACSAPDRRVRPGDVSVLNWGTSPLGAGGPPAPDGPMGCGNDYGLGNLVGVSRAERGRQLRRARDRAQAYLHWLQSARGLPLRPRGDLTGTADGIALEPYVREARRGVALTTVRHEDVAARFFPGRARARTFDDSVGIGAYHYLDFHPGCAPGHVQLGEEDRASLPFTVPLGALIPIGTDGLVLSAKSIGTTHITNAAYRMHPVEWAIGEAGGRLAAFALREGVEPREVRCDPARLRRFQVELARAGIPLVWFDDVAHDDPDFAAIQLLAVAGILPGADPGSLHFDPEGRVDGPGGRLPRRELARVLLRAAEGGGATGLLPADARTGAPAVNPSRSAPPSPPDRAGPSPAR
ncbi:MAG: FAD-dependent oxidoreductase [Synechococcaceae cyanobacterium]|nr:FAD-dependent oxidoreductase [Synechococcaceae cyanobacterium]